MDNSIKAGDIVYLKSGSPAMTVENVAGQIVTCSWYDGVKINTKDFYLSALTTTSPH